MGVYYYFTNERTGECNQEELFPDSDIYWYAKLNYYNEEEQCNIFRKVIALNEDWLATDTIVARPDSNSACIQYCDGAITYLPSPLEDFVDDVVTVEQAGFDATV